MELFEEMEEKDTHLFSQMQTRKLAVTGLDWEVQPFSEDEIDKEIADFIDEQLKELRTLMKCSLICWMPLKGYQHHGACMDSRGWKECH